MITFTLKEGISCASFMRAVNQCQGKVLLRTRNGDSLNLKSELSRLVFLTAFAHSNLELEATVELADARDYHYFAAYKK